MATNPEPDVRLQSGDVVHLAMASERLLCVVKNETYEKETLESGEEHHLDVEAEDRAEPEFWIEDEIRCVWFLEAGDTAEATFPRACLKVRTLVERRT